MVTKLKKIIVLLMCVMLMITPMVVYAESDVDIQPHMLTVQVTGSGTVSVEGEGITVIGDNLYSVQSGKQVTVANVPGEGQELFSMMLDEVEVPESFKMPFKDAVLHITFKEAQSEVESSVTDGQPEQKSEEIDIEHEVQENEQEIVFQDHIVAKMLPVNELGVRPPMANSVRLVRDPYVGMVLSGINASVLFQGVPGTAGTFLVSINDGELAGATGTGYCLDPGAANPGEGSPVICTWTATCTGISGNMATWYFVMTPPGVAAPGSVFGYQRVGMTVTIPFESKGALELIKSSANPELTDGNSCYSREGAVYGLYSGANKVAELTTDSNGWARADDLTAGAYTVKELTAPRGYALDLKTYNVTINSGQVTRLDVKDLPQSDPISILLGKVDAETTKNMPQGSASLEGAEFTVKYYAVQSSTDPALTGVVPLRTWVLKTDEDGRCRLREDYKLSGDDFWLNSFGYVTLPIGTITIQETKAPDGYLLNDEIFVRQITSSGTAESVGTYNEPTIQEDVIRGDLQIVKFGQDVDDKTEQKTALSGIIFELTSKTTGEKVEIVTEENGYASTQQLGNPRGGLVWDTYIVHEKNTPPGFKPVDDFEITISEEGQTLYYILEDKLIVSPVQLVKVDAETGNTIPLANAEFQLLDANKNVITMTTHYPAETVHETFKTDDTGSFTLPEKLTVGVYYFREVNAPEGYLLNGEDIRFEITESHDWDAPFVVTFSDMPAKGRIQIVKIDERTGDVLAGTEFEIIAFEDIVTPDGTVRALKNEVVDWITTEWNGRAESKELYLGKYLVREIRQTPGFARSDKTYEVELIYKDQITEVVTKEIDVVNTPTSLVIKKMEKGETEKWLEGVKFKVWYKGAVDGMQENAGEAEEIGGPEGTAEPEGIVDSEGAVALEGTGEIDSGFTQDMIYTTDENGMIRIDYLLPNSTYCVQEIETLSGYVLDDTVYEITVDENGMIEGSAEHVLIVENERIPEEPVPEEHIPEEPPVVKTGDDEGAFIMLVYLIVSFSIVFVVLFRRAKRAEDYENRR